MKKKILLSLSLLSAALFSTAYADAPGFGNPHVVLAKTNKLIRGLPQTKPIAFMSIKATPEQQKAFMSYDVKTPATENLIGLPPPSTASYSWMASMPVLDQGVHGSCATFSNTGALNALLFWINPQDSISQLCNLALGSAFDRSTQGASAIGYLQSGWNGTFGIHVLEQLERFGAVPTVQEATGLCGGVTSYPGKSPNIPPAMQPSAFVPMSKNVMSMVLWSGLLMPDQRYSTDPARPYNGPNLVRQMKRVLAGNTSLTGSRLLVTIGFQLYAAVCDTGACAKKDGSTSTTNDTWALTPEITQQTAMPPDGHEVIVYGYDDDAVATDSAGNKHKGLLLIRNSWGPTMGDKGNYYMSYDYFYKYAIESYSLRTMSFKQS